MQLIERNEEPGAALPALRTTEAEARTAARTPADNGCGLIGGGLAGHGVCLPASARGLFFSDHR